MTERAAVVRERRDVRAAWRLRPRRARARGAAAAGSLNDKYAVGISRGLPGAELADPSVVRAGVGLAQLRVVEGPQLALEDLPRRIARELVDEGHLLSGP